MLQSTGFPGRCLAAVLPLMALIGCTNQAPVLNYHWVGEGTGQPWDLEPSALADQLDYLKENGWTTVSLADYFDQLDGRRKLPRRAVLLTFDDGHASVYRVAYPMLKQRGMRAALFLISDFIKDADADRYDLPGPMPMPMLVWPEVREMVASGTFEVGSHTRTHRDLTRLRADKVREEVAGSREDLAAQLGAPIAFFSYPLNGVNDDVAREVEEAGYRGAFGGGKGLGGRYNIWRITVHLGDDLQTFRQKLSRSWADVDSD